MAASGFSDVLELLQPVTIPLRSTISEIAGKSAALRLEVKKSPVARPRLLLSVAWPKGVVPSSKVMVPVGMVEVGMALVGVPETVAFKVTGAPARATGLETVSET